MGRRIGKWILKEVENQRARSYSSPTKWGHSQEVAICKPGRAPTRNRSCQTLVLGSSLQNCQKISFLLLKPPVADILLIQSSLTIQWGKYFTLFSPQKFNESNLKFSGRYLREKKIMRVKIKTKIIYSDKIRKSVNTQCRTLQLVCLLSKRHMFYYQKWCRHHLLYGIFQPSYISVLEHVLLFWLDVKVNFSLSN